MLSITERQLLCGREEFRMDTVAKAEGVEKTMMSWGVRFPPSELCREELQDEQHGRFAKKARWLSEPGQQSSHG